MDVKEKYYIYYHIDPRDGLPKYVGKGSGNRAWELGKSRRSRKHLNWILKLRKLGLEPLVFIGKTFKNEEECFNVEKLDIAFFKKIDLPLKNISLGGNGVRLTPELIRRRSDNAKKPIFCITNNTRYPSTVDCAKELGILPKRINDVLRGRKKTYKGFRFIYIKEE